MCGIVVSGWVSFVVSIVGCWVVRWWLIFTSWIGWFVIVAKWFVTVIEMFLTVIGWFVRVIEFFVTVFELFVIVIYLFTIVNAIDVIVEPLLITEFIKPISAIPIIVPPSY